MSVAVEVDELDKLIVSLVDEFRKRKTKAEQLRKEVQEAVRYVGRCREMKDLCLKNLSKLKKLKVVPIIDYRDMVKLYEDNCDLLIQHQTYMSARSQELNNLVQIVIPYLESSIAEAKRKRARWGIVLPFSQ